MGKNNHEMMLKVPQITIVFWIAKLLTTAFGEAFSDFIFFGRFFSENVTILIGLGVLLIFLAIQLTIKKYIPWIYWLTVTAVAVFGTMAADFINKAFGLSFYQSTLMFLGLQTVVFITWYATEKTLNIHSIYTHRREVFYWLTVLFTFALGTAAGDFTANTLRLGTLASTFIFLVIILVPVIGFKWLKFNEVFAFWFAYTITRPLGASLADWLGTPAPYGDGLQLGTRIVSLLFGILIFAIFIFIDYKHRKEGYLDNHSFDYQNKG
jgi:uncharacterized membrane-anchored protein